MAKQLLIVGTKVSSETVKKLDSLAAKMEFTRSEFVRYLIESAVSKPGLAEELMQLESEKKERLIRYIM